MFRSWTCDDARHEILQKLCIDLYRFVNKGIVIDIYYETHTLLIVTVINGIEVFILSFGVYRLKVKSLNYQLHKFVSDTLLNVKSGCCRGDVAKGSFMYRKIKFCIMNNLNILIIRFHGEFFLFIIISNNILFHCNSNNN